MKILLPMHFGEVELIALPTTLVSAMDRFRPDVVLLDSMLAQIDEKELRSFLATLKKITDVIKD